MTEQVLKREAPAFGPSPAPAQAAVGESNTDSLSLQRSNSKPEYTATGVKPAGIQAAGLSATTNSAKEMWDSEKKPWASTAGGRLAIRSISRGIIGAAFYTWGTQKIARDMPGYSLDKKPDNALQHVARAFDTVAGKPIEKIFNKMGKDGKAIVTFRPSLASGGRTLGEDAIYNTFDFAAASAGDAMGREIIGLFDPSVQHKWKGENGKISLPNGIKSLAAATSRIFLAQAEDWFVAVPYTFQQKFQRKVINKFSPGFEYTADSTLHGSCYKLDENGKIKGTYGWEGVLDLQGRFTGYNFGTGLFRDIVKGAKEGVANMRDPERKAHRTPEKLTPETMFKAGQSGARKATSYLLNRAVKTLIVMTPSVPIFSMLRIPQNRNMGIGLMPDGTEVPLGRRDEFQPDQLDRSQWSASNRMLDNVLDPFGKAANSLSDKLGGAVQTLARSDEGKQKATDFARTYVNASMAYTPYIFAKNEFALMWDNKSMDKAVDRTVDGMFSGKFSEVKSGVKDIAQVIASRRKVKKDEKGFADSLRPAGPETARFADKLPRERTAANWQEQVAQAAGAEPALSHR
ncbi:MAG: hypothetical protein FJX23_06615 [Alphaproteobacteria bacterium]|nr:hypothetical protein [Alphaproteobacteria bacterium]